MGNKCGTTKPVAIEVRAQEEGLEECAQVDEELGIASEQAWYD